MMKKQAGANMEEEERSVLQKAYDHIEFLQDELAKVLADPLVHAVVSACKNELDPAVFKHDDLVGIMVGEYAGKTARIVALNGTAVNKGVVEVILPNLTRQKYRVGLPPHPPEVKLFGKNDGTNVTIIHNGTYYDVHGVFGKKFEPGQHVKVNMKSLQILDDKGQVGAGDICFVDGVVDETAIEVEVAGKSRVVLNGDKSKKIEIGDRVQLDQSSNVILRHLGRKDDSNYVLEDGSDVTWNDIGGCQEAKEAMIEAVELPFKHPNIYKFYNLSLPKGVLLYGPPGTGKTMLGKAAANSIAKTFGKDKMKSGFIYVKGPELLSMWVGNSEQRIRELFRRGDDHFNKFGAPAFLFIDEAEAILPMRGSKKSSDVESTIVPMFLSEMDGLKESHVVVILATNRPALLDPAAVRAGRIDRHIKVPRPDQLAATEILKIHMKKVPMCKCDANEVVALTVAELFSKEWVIYKLSDKGQSYTFTMSDCVNGAMLADLTNKARTSALRRDLKCGQHRGVIPVDFKNAIGTTYRGLLDQNASFDLEDYIDSNNISRDVKIEKMQAEK